MKANFVSLMRFFILVLSVLSIFTLMTWEFAGKVFFNVVNAQPGWGVYVFQTLVYVTFVLAILFAHEFQRPKDTGSWLTLITIWGFNIFTLLFAIGVFDFGGESRAAAFFVLVLITLIIDIFAFFPYEAFQKREAKP